LFYLIIIKITRQIIPRIPSVEVRKVDSVLMSAVSLEVNSGITRVNEKNTVLVIPSKAATK
jgi:hypothetical protein